MSLKPCPDCEREMSHKAKHCMVCGCPIKKKNVKKWVMKRVALKLIAWTIAGAALFFVGYLLKGCAA